MTGFLFFSSSLILSLSLILMVSGFVGADPCGHGFQHIGERCYKLHLTSKVTWGQAKNSCRQERARLAIIRLRSEINALTPYLRAANAKFVHVGVKKDRAGVWRYSDSRCKVIRQLWGRNQPSRDGNCGNLLNAHAWDPKWIGWHLNDEPCGTKIGFICQNPCLLGYQYFGKKCFKSDPCSHGFQYIGERCYKLHLTSKVTWGQAKNSCARDHARLAVIRLGSQINALTPYLRAANANFVHVGLKKDRAGVWRYVDRRPVNNRLWGRNQPSRDGTCGNLLNANAWDRSWIGWRLNDERCGTKIGFICER